MDKGDECGSLLGRKDMAMLVPCSNSGIANRSIRSEVIVRPKLRILEVERFQMEPAPSTVAVVLAASRGDVSWAI